MALALKISNILLLKQELKRNYEEIDDITQEIENLKRFGHPTISYLNKRESDKNILLLRNTIIEEYLARVLIG